MSNPFRLAYLEELSKKQKKIDKNHNGKIDGQDLQILRKEEKQDQTKNAPDNAKALGKGGKVDTQKYSWGTMKTVHHGSDFSIPLHPEHHQEIAKLKDQQEHKFKDETGRHWTAKKMGDNVHFQGANGGGKTHVPAHTMNEHAPIAPVPPKKKEQMKPRVGHPTAKEETLLSRIAQLAEAKAKVCPECGKKPCQCAVNEEFLGEANHRDYACASCMHPSMAKHMSVGQEHDYYEPKTGDKVSGKVMHKSDTEVHMKQTHDSYDPKKKGTVHKFKVTDKLDEEVISEEGYSLHSKKTNADGTVTVMLKTPSGKIVKHTGKNIGSAVKAKYGVDAGIQEATTPDESAKKEKSLEQHADDYAERATMDPAQKIIRKKQFMAMVGKDGTTTVDPIKGPSSNKFKSITPIGVHEDQNEETMKLNSFKSYMQEELDEAMWPGTPEYKEKYGHTDLKKGQSRKSASGSGTITGTGTGYKHERDYEKAEKETSTPEGQEKRGRGRPKGAASGARQKGSAAKSDDDRYDSTGYKLHLPK
jgi:membrane protease subunit (stomatin/prohibitin family)